jgi:hypothetical protein
MNLKLYHKNVPLRRNKSIYGGDHSLPISVNHRIDNYSPEILKIQLEKEKKNIKH